MKNKTSPAMYIATQSIRSVKHALLAMALTLVLSASSSVVLSQCDTVLALTCETAPSIPLANYCGRSNPTALFCCTAFCGANTAVHNPTYHHFIATSTSILIEIQVLPCEEGFGLQSAIIDACPWINSNILACDPGTPTGGTMTLQADNVIPGQSYWLLIDGSVGSMCSFLITHVIGLSGPPPIIVNLQSSGTTLNAIAEGTYPFTYAWFGCEENEVLGTGATFEAPGLGCYCVTVRDSVNSGTYCTTVTTTKTEDEEFDSTVDMRPNPSSDVVDVSVSGDRFASLSLKIYDYQGRCIKDSFIQDGKYRHQWQDDQAPGIYLFVIASEEKVLARRSVVFTGDSP